MYSFLRFYKYHLKIYYYCPWLLRGHFYQLQNLILFEPPPLEGDIKYGGGCPNTRTPLQKWMTYPPSCQECQGGQPRGRLLRLPQLKRAALPKAMPFSQGGLHSVTDLGGTTRARPFGYHLVQVWGPLSPKRLRFHWAGTTSQLLPLPSPASFPSLINILQANLYLPVCFLESLRAQAAPSLGVTHLELNSCQIHFQREGEQQNYNTILWFC